MKKKVVLYNPRAVFWTMPLALIAVGSALDRSKYEVVLVDGRLETNPIETVLSHLRGDAVCLGITVLTGAPIRDALNVSRAVKAALPSLPIVWGGWHPSLFPGQCLSEPSVDAAVVGQGEITFAEIVDRLAVGQALDGVAGCVVRTGGFAQSEAGNLQPLIQQGPPRAFRDVNTLPAHDYSLIDVERYFAHKGKRQLDYVSSQGCRFRCTFCADPTVFRRGWYGLDPQRMAQELMANHATYRIEEISFQDETFFTSRERVRAIARAFLDSGLRVSWSATMRSDQGERLDDKLMALCRRSGLRRVMIGVESGSPEMLQRIRKDITLPQVIESAARCARHDIGAIYNFIVGFPGESGASIHQTMDLAARLRAMHADSETSIFYFRAYPGNPIAEELVRAGYRFPASLEDWADFDFYGGREEWLSHEQVRQIERFKFYQRFAFGRSRPILRRPLQWVSRWRVNRRFYKFPIEKAIIERLRPAQKLS